MLHFLSLFAKQKVFVSGRWEVMLCIVVMKSLTVYIHSVVVEAVTEVSYGWSILHLLMSSLLSGVIVISLLLLLLLLSPLPGTPSQ